MKSKDKSIFVGALLIIIMVIGLAMSSVRMTGILPNDKPITVQSFTEEGAQIKLQKGLKRSGYSHYKKIIIR